MKTKSIYIYPNEERSGCRIISLGMMSFLKRRIKRVAFFKPVIDQCCEEEEDINAVLEYFRLEQSPDSAFGLTLSEAQHRLLSSGHVDELLGAIIERYKALGDEYDFILCHGQRRNIFENLGFDLNIKIANSMAAPLLPVLKGKGRDPESIFNNLRIFDKFLKNSDGSVFALCVNRVDPEVLPVLKKKVREWDYPVFLLPENHELDKLTMAEIARQLGADLVIGNPRQLDRTVNGSRVASMTVKNGITRFREGDLIIVPGDRDDIVFGTILANISRNYPSVAGLLLTAGLLPEASLIELLKGLDVPLLPVLSLAAETETAVRMVRDIKPGITLDGERKISLAMGIFNEFVDLEVMEERIETSSVDSLTPVMFEHLLYEKAKKNQKNILLPESGDERVLRAAEIALRRGVARITMLGDPEEVKARCHSLGLNLDDALIIDPRNSPWQEEFAERFYQLRKHKGIIRQIAREMMTRIPYFSTMMLDHGYVDGIVSGATHTTRETIKPALEIIKTGPGVKLVSSIFFMLLQNRVLVFGDCAVNPDPDPEELAQIAISSAATARAFGIETRVAMLSYSSGGSGVGKDVEKVRRATEIVKKLRPDILVEGPIQYDAAIDPGVAALKMPGSSVAGKATVFIFPELNTGNNTYKAVQRAAKALALGPVLQGLKKPVNDLSRGCKVGDIVYTIAITSIQAGAGG